VQELQRLGEGLSGSLEWGRPGPSKADLTGCVQDHKSASAKETAIKFS